MHEHTCLRHSHLYKTHKTTQQQQHDSTMTPTQEKDELLQTHEQEGKEPQEKKR